MEYKNILVITFFTIVLYIQTGNALKCYTCHSREPDNSCATPIETSKTPAITCNATTLSLGNTFNADLDPQILSQYSHAVQNLTQFECVTYAQHYFSDNKTETFRDCVQKGDFCKFLQNVPGVGKTYNVTKCQICDSDYCNSSTSLHASGLIVFSVLLWFCFSLLQAKL